MPPPDGELSPEEFLKKYTLPKKEDLPKLSEEELEKSKKKARLLKQSISVLEALFREAPSVPSVRLSINTSDDKEAMMLLVSGGEMDFTTLNALQRVVSDGNEIRTVNNSRFADLFPGSENRGISPENLLSSLRRFLTDVEEDR